MRTVTTGTLIDSVVQLDGQVDLPNHSRGSVHNVIAQSLSLISRYSLSHWDSRLSRSWNRYALHRRSR